MVHEVLYSHFLTLYPPSWSIGRRQLDLIFEYQTLHINVSILSQRGCLDFGILIGVIITRVFLLFCLFTLSLPHLSSLFKFYCWGKKVEDKERSKRSYKYDWFVCSKQNSIQAEYLLKQGGVILAFMYSPVQRLYHFLLVAAL
ncbi:hypothetical protein E2542_SST24449 [Spatholobus suberectus]|nr:hypothetical protein E2542_SST24449 [Spatholobus suberectus]